MTPVHPTRIRAVAFVLAAAWTLPLWAQQGPITFESLLEEMTDRQAAARFPEPAYTCRQASSYDQASVTPDDHNAWMANNDRSFFIRSETNGGREEWVMLDAAGPGCVVRFWATSGNPTGNVRVYLDGASEPVINEPVKRLVGGDALVGPPLSAVQARGMNLYLPIPYAKHCKITYDRPNFHKSGDEQDLLYYQINYRTYAPGAKVESFSREALRRAQPQLTALIECLSRERARPAARESVVTLSPGDGPRPAHAIAELAGPKAVTSLSVKIEAEDLESALRSAVLVGKFDGQTTIWCPLGDFFGGGVGVNPYQNWWCSVAKDGWMTCWWVMPFEKTCRLEVRNLGPQKVTVLSAVGTGDWNWDDRSMRFHANFRQEYPIDTARKFDWNYLEVAGKGVYMGDSLSIVNPVEAWWGEGDEKIYVDGEAFPSHFGTGTEDYYGYAWCTPAFFCSAFHAQPRVDGPGNRGHATNNRVRLLDGIPFTTAFRFDMEVWHWAQVEMPYAVATYWYGAPGAKGNYGPAPEQAVVHRPQPPKPRVVEGAIEGEDLKIVDKTDGETEIQDIPAHKWSGNRQLWWRDAQPGDKLTLSLPVEKAGRYKLAAAFTLAIDYGVVRLTLDGKPLGEPVDFFHDGVIWKVFNLGTHDLAAGQHRLTAEITGSNPAAVKRHMFGVDYFKLDAAE